MAEAAGERPIALTRWLAKKAARAMVGALTAVPAALGSAGEPRVRVLTYHRFGPGRRAPFCVDAAAFDRQMAWLARSGRAASLAQVRGFLGGRRNLDNGAVLVTIDDGDPSVAEIAVPILRRHGVPAVLFTLAGRPEGFRVLDDAALRAVADAGVDIGSHSLTHRSMARLPREQQVVEARDSRRRLEDILGRPVTTFAYPFGTRADYSDETAQVLREAGYDLAFTSQHGALQAGLDPLALPRVKVESGDPDWLFPLLCGGALDAWRLVDGGLYGLQRPA